MTWSKETIPKMRAFVADIGTFLQMFDDYQRLGLVKDPRAREVFVPFDLFDESGQFTIPVIEERDSNALYRSARAIAGGVSQHAPALLDLPELVRKFGFVNEEQALVVAYHELLWEVMVQLEELGLAEKPIALATPERARPRGRRRSRLHREGISVRASNNSMQRTVRSAARP